MTEQMKAVRIHGYGGCEVLRYEAHTLSESGRARGTIVLHVGQP